MRRLPYSERLAYCKNPLAKKLLQLIDEKKSNLALSADVTRADDLLRLADELGPEICVLKTHIDIVEDFNPALVDELQRLSRQHRFMIFEDRKFADIGNTVKLQYQGGIYHISEWADIINAHSLPGPSIISSLADIGLPKQRGLLLLAEMSSAGNLMDAKYAAETLSLAEKFPEFVMGFIAQHKIEKQPGWIYFSPGVQFVEKSDGGGQQYISPNDAILQGADIIIVGRGILRAANPLQEARRYRFAAWESLLQLIDSGDNFF